MLIAEKLFNYLYIKCKIYCFKNVLKEKKSNE